MEWKLDKFRSLEFFLATIDGGSFAAAAKQFATDPSTVSKAIKRLESQLGIQLFQRSTRQINLTQAGENYAANVRNLSEQLRQTEEALKADNELPTGKLCINLPVSYGRLYIQPILIDFNRLYPGIQLEVSFDDAYVDMIGQKIDVAIRSGSLSDSRLIAQKLSPIEFVICASPSYVKNNIDLNVSNLASHPWIRFRFKQTGKLMPIVGLDSSIREIVDAQRDIVVDDGEALAELSAAGLGLTQVPHFIAKSWVEEGKLVTLYPPYSLEGEGVYIVYPRREYLPQRVRLFIDFVKASLTKINESPDTTWLANYSHFKVNHS